MPVTNTGSQNSGTSNVHGSVGSSNPVQFQNPDGPNGTNAKIEGTTADPQAKVITVGGLKSVAWRNPA